MGDLTTSLLSPPVSDDDQEQDHPGDATKIRIRTSFRFEMPQEDHQRMQLRLAELVDLRNTLAHHFFEILDIRTEEGCAGAVAYLDDSFHLIDERFEELRKLAQHLVETSMDMVNFLRSPDNMESLMQEFFPATAGLASTSCTIVNLFRDAEAELAQDGWTSLAKAIEYITGREPSHTPRRYGCSSWRQVLHESGLFTIRHEQTKPGAKRDTWYRSRDV